MIPQSLIDVGYMAAAIFFIVGLKMLTRPDTARRGTVFPALGMLTAIVVTLLSGGLSFTWIIVGLLVGSVIGVVAARTVPMTDMPQMVALLNGSGGMASLLVGWAEFHGGSDLPAFTAAAIFVAVLIGGVAASGSVVAYGKLAGVLPGRSIGFRGQKAVNGVIAGALLLCGGILTAMPDAGAAYPLLVLAALLALALGVLGTIPIGGADMPVVIALLNSYSGLAACAAGFIILNNVLIVSGALVGASGFILTTIMCKAMNRSLVNVLFSGLRAPSSSGPAAAETGEVRSLTPREAYYILEAAGSVVFVPGYGMAVAQAQHVVRELADILEDNGAEVRFAIHPVSGRMPGHMNVLLAEANVPYEQLMEMDDVNPIMDTVDVCLVIGANDVVNPAAREIESSPIYGMPVVNVDLARTVIVLKRSLAAGFSGIDNSLFYKENTRMLFGDAKAALQGVIAEFKE